MTKFNKLWGTAFNKKTKTEAVLFCAGRDVQSLPAADEQLIPFEIEASLAYVKALADQKIINSKTCQQLVKALKELKQLYQQGKFKFDPHKEDVHTNIEAWLIDKLGMEIAGQIHSGRSRNEQGIIDIVLYIKKYNEIFKKEITALIQTLFAAGKKYQQVIISGYTHHQPATVTTFGEILNSYAYSFSKDLKKFVFWNESEEISPLGASTGYGSSYPVSKKAINKYLNLKQVFKNSIQVITGKGDAELQMVFNLAVFLNHLSSLAETLIIFGTKEFGFVKISETYSTGSSIMPQKKNPDTLEVIKAKASMLHGYLASLLSLTKSTFIGYNRDLQWSKYLVMDAINEAILAPSMMTGVIKTLTVSKKKMLSQTQGFLLSQAVMENLAMHFHLPMRLAKLIMETTVKKCAAKGKLELQVLNEVLHEYQLTINVSQKLFNNWTDPLQVVKDQLKKENNEF